ncbi:hypothetical protein L6R53_23480 [Myxococcota bacterium]|nr:hypothetical protein [Myxococcota bacterium]
MPRRLALAAAGLALALSSSSCGERDAASTSQAPASSPTSGSRTVDFEPSPIDPGLRIELSDASPAGDAYVRPPTAAATPASAEQVAALLSRLPPLPDEALGQAEFNRRAESRPAPRPGVEVAVPFLVGTVEGDAPAVQSGPLTVLRASPEGEVPMAPHLSITFDQPMVALTSQDEAAAVVPARLEPQPPGQWRWLGTRTLTFEPAPGGVDAANGPGTGGRFPMATAYTVTVPRGTKGVAGQPLAEDHVLRFQTPPPRVVAQSPVGGPVDRQPVLLVGFDQAVDAEVVRAALRVSTAGKVHPVRMATEAERAAVKDQLAQIDQRGAGRWLAVVPAAPLPLDSTVTVSVPAGTPSAEGPLTTKADQAWSFRTYGALSLEESQCGWRDRCAPSDTIQLRFNNPLDVEAFDPAWVKVSPEIPGLQLYASGAWLNLEGLKQAETAYTITVDGALRDSFGQTLGQPVTVRKKTGKDEPAQPWMTAPGPELRVLDPVGTPTYAVYTVNHETLRLRVYRVQPQDWAAYRAWRDHRGWWDEDTRLPEPPGTRLADQRIAVQGQPDRLTETAIDLSPWLEDGQGQVLVWVEAPNTPKGWGRQVAITWAQRTKLGVTALSDASELVALVTDLSTGAAVTGASVELSPTGPTLSTDAQGLARGALPDGGTGPQLLIARQGADLAFVPVGGGWGEHAPWTRRDPGHSLAWFVFDDRHLYKPGEQVRVKGWLRSVGQGRGGDVGPLGEGGPRSLTWVLSDSRGSELARGKAPVVGLGGFDLRLDLPDDMNLGTAWVQLQAEDGAHGGTAFSHAFEVQEFRRPEYEVTASVEAGPFVLGQTATASVTAAYYAGGALPGAQVRWTVQPSWADYRPPNQEGWQFGLSIPWWWGRWWEPAPPPLAAPAPHAATTDAMGAHHLAMHFAALGTPRPVQVEAQAVVEDVNRQAWASSTRLLVHPSEVYVGLRTARPFAEAGQPVEVELMAVDLDGRPVAGRPVTVRWWTDRWQRTKAGGWEEVEDDVQTCEKQSAGGTGKDAYEARVETCRFTPKAGGRYTAQATVVDAAGRPNRTEVSVWVQGDEGDRPRDRSVSAEAVLIVPDKERYAPGDVAELLVQSPIGPAEGLLSLRRSGLVEVRRFRIDGESTVLTVPVEDAMVPTLHVHVDLVGSTARTDDQGATRADLPRQPAWAQGSLTIDVPPVRRALSVAVTPAATALDPGASTTLDVQVQDADGQGVAGAELAVVVVDEAVLALTGYRIADPLAAFYVARGGDVSEEHLRAMLWLGDPAAMAGMGAGPGGPPEALPTTGAAMPMMMADGGDMALPPPSPSAAPVAREMAKSSRDGESDDARANAPDASGPAIALRTDLRALALFLPAERTGADGSVTVPLTLPDSLTRYRVTVVAVEGGQRFGSGEAAVTSRKPLMLRPSAPRFLNFGDKAELPFVVQNQTDQAMQVVLAAGAANARFEGEGGSEGSVSAGRIFEVPAQDRVEVRLPVTTLRAGTATFQAALSGRAVGVKKAPEATDAAQLSLPVWTPATSEAFATYGEIGGLPPAGAPPGGDPGAILQQVKAPAEVWPQYGGLEITTSSTAVQALTDALLYLVEYPFECAEQRASRVLAIAALRDVLTAFDAEGLPDPAALQAAVERDVAELARLQNHDGGWGFWRQGEQSWPFVTLHVAHALARAEAKGFTVPPETRRRALAWLRSIERRLPGDYPESTRQALRAYALYVRHLLSDTDSAEALALYRRAGIADVGRPGLSLESLAWILPSLHAGKHQAQVDEILRFVDSRIAETAAGAQISTGYGEGDWLILHSDRRTDAVVLEALIAVAPRHDVVPKLVRGLLDHRVKGHWGSTQENAFVLLALDRYFAVYESETPDFVARAWLGEVYAGEHAFRGRSTEHATITVPMTTVQELAGGDGAPLVLQRDGKGRMYYRVGLRYAPKSLELAPADRGFVVLRTYEAVDDPADVQRGADGAWQVKAGARVRVRLTMVADARRTHVALVDPLPAGLEVINPELAVSEDIPADPQASSPEARRGGGWWWWWMPWYEHENLRDERVEAFTTLLWPGVHEYSYVARATTPGDFVIPPAKAEEMYHPETFGRSASERLRVVAGGE